MSRSLLARWSLAAHLASVLRCALQCHQHCSSGFTSVRSTGRETSISPHLPALLDLLPALAQPGQVHLALAAHVVLLKLGDPHACHIVGLGDDSDLSLFGSRLCKSELTVSGSTEPHVYNSRETHF